MNQALRKTSSPRRADHGTIRIVDHNDCPPTLGDHALTDEDVVVISPFGPVDVERVERQAGFHESGQDLQGVPSVQVDPARKSRLKPLDRGLDIRPLTDVDTMKL